MNDDALFDAVASLIGSGEYLDQVPGSVATDEQGSGWLHPRSASQVRRLYQRGTPDYDAARAAGLLERLPTLEPASPENVRDAEAELGYPLPALLRRMFLELANGGFGPGYGILGLRCGHTDDMGKTAIDLVSADHLQAVNAALLPLCHWGCAIYSLVDCASDDQQMWAFDPNPAPEGVNPLVPLDDSLDAWLGRWVAAKLTQPALVLDPVTEIWRGATVEETQRLLDEE